MIFRQFLDEELGCASYLVGDGGEAVVVDPGWEIERYLAFARGHRVVICHVVDTHVHADHVSGRSRLAAATGSVVYLPPGTGAAAKHRLLGVGGCITVGAVRLDALPTPGHRPEHISLLVSEADEPCLLLSGDSLLVGNVARPDLAIEPDGLIAATHALRRSLQRLALLPDHVEVWPGHIAGSLCAAGGLNDRVSSTIGFERRVNPGLMSEDTSAFTEQVVAQLGQRPPTIDTVVALNRSARIDVPACAPLSPLGLLRLQADGALVLDGRPAAEFDCGSIPGSVSVPLDAGAAARAAWYVRPDDAIIAVAGNDTDAHTLALRLAAVGLINVSGVLQGGMAAWRRSDFPLVSTERIDVPGLAALVRADAVSLIDVRDRSEFDDAHVLGSRNLPWNELRGLPRQRFDPDLPVVVACASGRRTALAASAIARDHGVRPLRLAAGGIGDLAEHGIELRGSPATRRRVLPIPATTPALTLDTKENDR